MRRKLISACVVAAALVVGLIVSALGAGPQNLSGPAGARHQAFSDVDPRSMAPGAAAWTEDVKSGSYADGSKTADAAKHGGAPAGKPNDPPEAGPDVPDPEDVPCTTAEREAIGATADGMREDVLDDAEAAKAALLDQLGLGSLLGGVPQSVQERLDAIDASAQAELDEVDALVADAVAVCETGGDSLSPF